MKGGTQISLMTQMNTEGGTQISLMTLMNTEADYFVANTVLEILASAVYPPSLNNS